MDNSPAGQAPAVPNVASGGGSSAAVVLLWITFVIAISAMVFLYLANRSLANSVSDKEDSKKDIVAELSSQKYVEIEQNAKSFSDSATILTEVSATRYPKREVMEALYSNLTRDIKLNSLSLGEDGVLVLDGATSSYRAVADLMTGLKAYDKISNITLGSVSLDTSDEAPVNQKITFSINASLNTKKETASTNSNTGGSTVPLGEVAQ